MKKLYSFLLLSCSGFIGQAQNVAFPDPELKDILLLASPDLHFAKDLSGNFFKIDANNDGEIQLSEALQVSYIDLSNITEIEDMNGIENFTNLTTLKASNNVQIINLNGLADLEWFSCSNNGLTALDLSGSPNLKYLDCSWGQIASLNILGLAQLEYVDVRANPSLGQLNLTGLTSLETLYCSSNGLTSLNVSGLSHLKYVDCTWNQLTAADFSGLANLETLYVSNNHLTSINLSGSNNLNYVDFSYNEITTVNLSGLANLRGLGCAYNFFSSLDLTGLVNIQGLYCGNNQLTNLNLGNLTQLEELDCSHNALTTLDFTGLTHLYDVSFGFNQISAIDVTNLPNLHALGCGNNLLTALDFSANHNLYNASCINNPLLTTINFKNGATEYCTLEGCPNLQYVCVDDDQILLFQEIIANYNLSNCHVNSYCTFTPGGDFYTIQGANRLDLDGNGCSPADIAYPNLGLSFNNGTTTSSFIADATGSYHYDVEQGTQTIVPILENPTYFNVSPATPTTVTFPTETSPYTLDFCISPNGIHNDLEIVLIPLSAARPGFDASYQIVYKNKGTHTQSGTINLAFDDNVMDFVSATPLTTSQATNILNWDFTDLLPFETRYISFTLNLNSPVETPPLNAGDINAFTATVNGASDETPNDNNSILNQTVRNSFDPNDKTCLEGNAITPAMVGNYVHYIIRFENTGTFPAENIVVKDDIDTTKFDIASLVPESGSHHYITRITGNKVEFIFENINLPFDDAHNDGYVAFKIKTKPTLVLGDTFSNTANIYFDYNFPITTNTVATTIQTLGTPDFEFGNYFSLFPNPAKNVLNLQAKAEIGVKSINIYNMLGQLVIAVPNAETVTSIDVSDLQSGNYFIKVNTDKGSSTAKFIKQ